MEIKLARNEINGKPKTITLAKVTEIIEKEGQKIFYFDKENLYFLYNQYEITAYAAGPVLIKIPFSDIKLMVKPEFLKRIAVQ